MNQQANISPQAHASMPNHLDLPVEVIDGNYHFNLQHRQVKDNVFAYCGRLKEEYKAFKRLEDYEKLEHPRCEQFWNAKSGVYASLIHTLVEMSWFWAMQNLNEVRQQSRKDSSEYILTRRFSTCVASLKKIRCVDRSTVYRMLCRMRMMGLIFGWEDCGSQGIEVEMNPEVVYGKGVLSEVFRHKTLLCCVSQSIKACTLTSISKIKSPVEKLKTQEEDHCPQSASQQEQSGVLRTSVEFFGKHPQANGKAVEEEQESEEKGASVGEPVAYDPENFDLEALLADADGIPEEEFFANGCVFEEEELETPEKEPIAAVQYEQPTESQLKDFQNETLLEDFTQKVCKALYPQWQPSEAMYEDFKQLLKESVFYGFRKGMPTQDWKENLYNCLKFQYQALESKGYQFVASPFQYFKKDYQGKNGWNANKDRWKAYLRNRDKFQRDNRLEKVKKEIQQIRATLKGKTPSKRIEKLLVFTSLELYRRHEKRLLRHQDKELMNLFYGWVSRTNPYSQLQRE